jgi:hypothetical protein
MNPPAFRIREAVGGRYQDKEAKAKKPMTDTN